MILIGYFCKFQPKMVCKNLLLYSSLTSIVDLLDPSGQNLADSAGNPRGLWLLVEGIYVEVWVVSETRIHTEIQGNFQIGVEMRGKTCKHFKTSP